MIAETSENLEISSCPDYRNLDCQHPGSQKCENCSLSETPNTVRVPWDSITLLWNLTPWEMEVFQDPKIQGLQLLRIQDPRNTEGHGLLWQHVAWRAVAMGWLQRVGRGVLEQGLVGCGRARHVGTSFGMVGRSRVRCGLVWMNVAGVAWSSLVAHGVAGTYQASRGGGRRGRWQGAARSDQGPAGR